MTIKNGKFEFYLTKLDINPMYKKIKRKIKKWNILYNNNQLNYNKFILCFNSFKGHIKHVNTYNLYNKLYNKIEFIN